MNHMNNKQQLIEYLRNNERVNTWLELAIKFNIKPNKSDKQRAKAANDIWRRASRNTTEFITEQQEFNVPKGFEIKSQWMNAGGKMLFSYKPVKTLDSQKARTDILEDFKNYSPDLPTSIYSTDAEKKTIAYQVNLPDFHFGRIDLEQAKTLFLTTVSQLVARVKNNYNIERFILPIGNDYFNSDLKIPKGGFATTKGTAQQDVAELEDTFRVGWQTLVDAITYLETIAPVYVSVVPGNHDKYRAMYLGDVIYSWFRNSKNVFVDNGLHFVKNHTYGMNSLLFHHGDGIKADKYPLIFAQEFPMEFATSKYKEVYLGHIHKHMVDEVYGVKINFLPSIAPNSRWETESGYKHNHCALGIKLHRTEGCLGYEQVNA